MDDLFLRYQCTTCQREWPAAPPLPTCMAYSEKLAAHEVEVQRLKATAKKDGKELKSGDLPEAPKPHVVRIKPYTCAECRAEFHAKDEAVHHTQVTHGAVTG